MERKKCCCPLRTFSTENLNDGLNMWDKWPWLDKQIGKSGLLMNICQKLIHVLIPQSHWDFVRICHLLEIKIFWQLGVTLYVSTLLVWVVTTSVQSECVNLAMLSGGCSNVECVMCTTSNGSRWNSLPCENSTCGVAKASWFVILLLTDIVSKKL